MTSTTKFGPNAQTAAQRATILKHMEEVCPGIINKASAYTTQLYERYVQGELSWGEIRALRGLHEKPSHPPLRPACIC